MWEKIQVEVTEDPNLIECNLLTKLTLGNTNFCHFLFFLINNSAVYLALNQWIGNSGVLLHSLIKARWLIKHKDWPYKKSHKQLNLINLQGVLED